MTIYYIVPFIATFMIIVTIIAYHNGVADGYGFSQEPSNPKYIKAKNYLQKHMHHRWPHLKRWDNDTR